LLTSPKSLFNLGLKMARVDRDLEPDRRRFGTRLGVRFGCLFPTPLRQGAIHGATPLEVELSELSFTGQGRSVLAGNRNGCSEYATGPRDPVPGRIRHPEAIQAPCHHWSRSRCALPGNAEGRPVLAPRQEHPPDRFPPSCPWPMKALPRPSAATRPFPVESRNDPAF
jgi:hypothetical protein